MRRADCANRQWSVRSSLGSRSVPAFWVRCPDSSRPPLSARYRAVLEGSGRAGARAVYVHRRTAARPRAAAWSPASCGNDLGRHPAAPSDLRAFRRGVGSAAAHTAVHTGTAAAQRWPGPQPKRRRPRSRAGRPAVRRPATAVAVQDSWILRRCVRGRGAVSAHRTRDASGLPRGTRGYANGHTAIRAERHVRNDVVAVHAQQRLALDRVVCLVQ